MGGQVCGRSGICVVRYVCASGRSGMCVLGLSIVILLLPFCLGTVVVMIVFLLDVRLPLQSVPITTEVVNSNHAQGGALDTTL